MNIFVLDYDPATCARFHCDKHVVKMILESAQLLSTACSIRGIWDSSFMYKPTHTRHPCTLWAGASDSNFAWLRSLGLSLCVEYTRRYRRRHKTQSVIERMPQFEFAIPDCFALAMPERYKTSDAVESYREYYRGDKADIATYHYSETPEFMRN